MNELKLKLNSEMHGFPVGHVVSVQTDEHGVPLEKFWRRRLRDAVTDNCVEVVEPLKPKKAKQSKSKNEERVK